ncbi:hypothetical protein L198_00031 [Cryptococcus wingfieldii CBS 7118]|uniref:Rab-GAP TBC domain-containing protein n=1 Tax=Cryptococcus wingfieldii CBS 7118 TaxID=1295528 RepID=A0A1E3K528_9TREE|nr:hypothetical protein L198_00031 [Cryptococcus wingfieldii CBS 7118]ODO08308.1 hypothetical protein L198_00031 [Cryptococcus wingfieldii CBS 7118]
MLLQPQNVIRWAPPSDPPTAAWWLLSGMVNLVLKDFYREGQVGLGVEAEVFAKLLGEKDGKLAKAFREIGLHRTCFLLVASFTILALSLDRLLRLSQDHHSVLEYLQNLPQDSLMLPENFMKACEGVRYEEKEYKRTRAAVEKCLMR